MLFETLIIFNEPGDQPLTIDKTTPLPQEQAQAPDLARLVFFEESSTTAHSQIARDPA
jgi:hypothetical protein